jgi:alpha-beta hydrolase superfamily lysophospholipase
MRVLVAAALLVHLVCLVWLGRAERGGPWHLDLVLPAGIPATLYLPGPIAPAALRFPEPPGVGNGPPAVLLVHGYTSDRVAMSLLARRLARAGFGVLAIDVRGHGTNPRGFAQDPEGANLFEDLLAAAEWLRGSSWLDGSRLAVVGHSMGASAALRFAERDVGVDAAVMISGGWMLLGPLRPPNALFIYASGDLEPTHLASQRLAEKLAGSEARSFAARDAVRAVEMPGNDHTTILWSKAAAREIIAWLNGSFALEPAGEPDLAEPRATPVLLAAALLPLTLAGLGLAAGTLAPPWPRRERRSWLALAAFALAHLLALPLVAAAPLGAFLGLDVADVLGPLLGLTGLVLCAGVMLRGDHLLPQSGAGLGRSLAAGAAAFAALYALVAPLNVLTHNLTPSPARAWAGLQLAALLLPYSLGFEHCVRRGSALGSLGVGLAGRVISLAAIVLGVALGVVPSVVILLLVPIAIVFVLGEATAVAMYAAGGNRLASALVQAAFLAWMTAAAMPIRP